MRCAPTGEEGARGALRRNNQLGEYALRNKIEWITVVNGISPFDFWSKRRISQCVILAELYLAVLWYPRDYEMQAADINITLHTP